MAVAAVDRFNGTGFTPPPPPSRDQLRREFVAGGGSSWFGGLIQAARALPNPIDDVTADFGDDLYERMLFDPQTAACVSIFKASILETGPKIKPAVNDDDDPEYELSREICDQAQRMLQDLEDSWDDILWDLLDSVALGNKVAEQTYRFDKAIKDGRQIYVLDKLKVKPRNTTLFAVDTYTNVVGLLVKLPGGADPPAGSVILSNNRGAQYRLLPKEKFVISTFRPRNGDPRGSSILRPAYSPWWRKQQIVPEYLKYLSQFAGPSLVGKVPPSAEPVPDPDNPELTITPQQVFQTALQQFRNSTVIAIAADAEIEPLQMQGEGAAFLRALAHCDQQITKAVLTQELATEEGRHMARAAAEVHQDVLDTLVRQGKLGAQSMIRKQLFRRWVIVNWGEEVAHLAPYADLGATEARDEPAMWQGAAALMNSGWFAEDQLQAMDTKLGLPMRSEPTALAFQAEATGEGEPAVDEAGPDEVVVRPHKRRRPPPRKPTEENGESDQEGEE